MRFFVLLCFCILLPFSYTKADIFGFDNTVRATDALLEKRLKQFFEGFNATAENVLSQGRQEGNLLLLQAGNEMKLAAATAIQALGAQLDERIGLLGDKATVAIARLDQMQRDAEDGLKHGRDFADLMTISAENIAAQLPFSKDAPFYIRRVQGLVAPYASGAIGHRVTLTGNGFGSRENGVTTTFDIRIDGRTYVTDMRGTGSAVQTSFILPASWIEARNSRTDLQTLKLDIKVTREEKGWFSAVWGPTVKTADVNLDLVLLPQVIGTLHVTQEVPRYDWLPVASKDVQREDIRRNATLVTMSLPSPDLDGIPTPGEMKWDRNSFRTSCKTNVLPHRKFTNGKLVRTNNRFFSAGWKASKYPKCTWLSKNYRASQEFTQNFAIRQLVQRASIEQRKNAEEFGSVFGNKNQANDYWKKQVKNANPKHEVQCHTIPANHLKEISKSVNHDVSGCRTVSLDRYEFRNRDSELHVYFKGSATVQGLWTLSAQRLRYTDTGQTAMIDHTPVEVTTQSTFAVDLQATPANRGAVELRLKSNIVPDVTFNLSRMPLGLSLLGSEQVNRDKRRFSFSYKLPR